jgi:2-polyprenyl-6-methoxyphenol hydroxylase-like FAD-dependent oxidoreductase
VTESLRANGGTNATDVLIVGGGPVGLSLGIELARLGVPAVLVDSRDGTIKTPKMNFVNVRSMEFCRRWGLTGAVRAAGHPADFHPNVVWATSVTGHEIARLDFPPFLEEKTRFFSPAADCLISQYWFDPILLAHAHAQPSLTLRHRTRLDSFRETGGGIAARVTDLVSGRAETVTAAYIVGCDGAASTVRDSLGIGLEGLPAMQNNFHVFLNSTELIEIFESTLGQARFCNLVGPEGVWGMITSINWRGLWRFSMQPPPADESLVPELLRRAVGRDFDFELLDSSHWVSRKLVADAFRKGRAFIAGDAAHQLNPSGGFGMNTGVGDAVDLCWKVDAALNGWAGDGLLDSYVVERRPVAERAVNEAAGNLGRMLSPGDNAHFLEDTPEGARVRTEVGARFSAAMKREWETLGMHLGYRYEGSPICVADGTPPTPDDPAIYIQTARPGSRAPHVRLADGRSTLDLFGRSFVLLCLGAGAPDPAPVAAAAGRRGMPLEVIRLDEPDAKPAYERRLVLVRPDGHVAWRGDAVPANADAIIDTVRGAR